MLFAVQPSLFPPPAPIDRMLIDTPQTLAAIFIGICALMGMFALSIFKSRARLLSTFDKLTLTSEVATPPTPDATDEPALLTPFTALDAVLQPDTRTSAPSAAESFSTPIRNPY